MSTPRHPDKDTREAIAYALEQGWTLQKLGGGHTWGVLLCHHGQRGGCRVRISSTPQNPGNHKRRIIRDVDACRHPKPEAQ